MLSIDSLLNFYESRNDDKEENTIKKYRRVHKTKARSNSVKTSKTKKKRQLKIPLRNENIKLTKKEKLKKFLTTISSYENRKNYDLEKIRFDKFWKEKNSYMNTSFSNSKTINGRNTEKNKYKKYINKSCQDIKPKKIKKNLKIEHSVERDLNIKNKKISNSMISDEIKRFCDFQETWSKFVNDKKNNIKQKIFEKEQNELNKFFYPYTNRYYNKKKYNQEKAIEQLNRKYELNFIKKKYKQNQLTYVHKPAININKYKNIPPKYNKYSNNKINKLKPSEENRKDKSFSFKNENNINIINKSKEKNINNKYNNDINIIQDIIGKKYKEEKKKNSLKYLISNINNKKKLIKDNIYYLNIDEATSCDTYINTINYNGRHSFIKQIILETHETPKKRKNNM